MKKKLFSLFLVGVILAGVNSTTSNAATVSCPTCGVKATSNCSGYNGSSSWQGTCLAASGCSAFQYMGTASISCSGAVKHTSTSSHTEYYRHDRCGFYNKICTY